MNTKICPLCKTPIPANAPGGLCPACILRDADEPAPAGRAAPSLAEIATAFPHLEIEKLIGQGGMGFVYKARQPSLDRVVALKILAPELSRDPAFAERFAREARVLGKLSHPNIVTIFEHGVVAATPSSQDDPNAAPGIQFYYLLMEFVDGVNLRQAMRAGRFTPSQALAVVPGICDALQAAHAQGVWHRDIKPENILLDAQGGVKIVDFGIARIVGDPARDFTLTATGAALGSAAYMAPEQHESPHDVDHRADIYSLGVVIYEMLTGELPLGRFPAPSQRAAVNARIDEIVFRTLEKERELRQQSAEEVKTDVHRAAKNVGEVPHSSIFAPLTPSLVAQAAILAGISLFTAAVLFTGGSDQGVLISLAVVPFVLGMLGVVFFKRDGAHPALDRRLAKRLGIALILLMCAFAAVAYFNQLKREQTNLEEMAKGARQMEEFRAQQKARELTGLQRSQASNTAPPEPQQNSPQADARSAAPAPSRRRVVIPTSSARNSVVDPQVPRVAQMEAIEADAANPRGGESPLETILRMNERANANDKEGFKRYLAMNVVPPEVDGYVAERMDVFTGKIVGVWRTGAEKRLGAQPDRAAPHPMYWFEREREGKRIVIQCFISVEQGRCLNFSQMPAPYRGTARVAFRPTEGDPLRILRGVLPENSGFAVEQFFADAAPVAGQFNAHSYAVPSAEVAAAKANELTQLIGDKLKGLGQDSTYRVIKAATVPERPEFFTMPNLEPLFPEAAKTGQ